MQIPHAKKQVYQVIKMRLVSFRPRNVLKGKKAEKGNEIVSLFLKPCGLSQIAVWPRKSCGYSFSLSLSLPFNRHDWQINLFITRTWPISSIKSNKRVKEAEFESSFKTNRLEPYFPYNLKARQRLKILKSHFF